MNLRHFNSNIIRKRLFVCLVVVVLFFMIVINRDKSQNCFAQFSFDDGRTLPEVTENRILIQHKSSKNVFFHETSCNPGEFWDPKKFPIKQFIYFVAGIVNLTPRQACAIESAAMLNPEHNIFVLFASQVGFRNLTPLPVIDALLSYPNIHLNYLNISNYANNTPLSKWMQSGVLYKSKYFNSHTSDVLRYLSLWKYGGTYLDLDVVMLQKLDDQFPKNYAGAESKNFVAVGVINLEGESGHEIAELCVQDLINNFDGSGEIFTVCNNLEYILLIH